MTKPTSWYRRDVELVRKRVEDPRYFGYDAVMTRVMVVATEEPRNRRKELFEEIISQVEKREFDWPLIGLKDREELDRLFKRDEERIIEWYLRVLKILATEDDYRANHNINFNCLDRFEDIKEIEKFIRLSLNGKGIIGLGPTVLEEIGFTEEEYQTYLLEAKKKAIARTAVYLKKADLAADDPWGIERFIIERHLKEVHQAISEGVEVDISWVELTDAIQAQKILTKKQLTKELLELRRMTGKGFRSGLHRCRVLEGEKERLWELQEKRSNIQSSKLWHPVPKSLQWTIEAFQSRIARGEAYAEERGGNEKSLVDSAPGYIQGIWDAVSKGLVTLEELGTTRGELYELENLAEEFSGQYK